MAKKAAKKAAKKSARPAAAKKAKKAAKKGGGRKANAAFMAPVTPSATLAPVVGDKPQSRVVLQKVTIRPLAASPAPASTPAGTGR